VRESSLGPVFRDVLYRRFGLVVELDGRSFHSGATARTADLDRDLLAALQSLDTVRLGWGQVFATGCRTAWLVGALLRQRGWAGSPAACPSCRPRDQAWWHDSRALLSAGDSRAPLSGETSA
jgi:hypothetical protein